MTNCFKDGALDILESHNSEIALIESFSEPIFQGKIIPIWGEKGTGKLVLEVKPLKGLRY